MKEFAFTNNQQGEPFTLRLKSHRFHTPEVAEALARLIKDWGIPVVVDVEPGEENYWRSLGLVPLSGRPTARQLTCSFEVANRSVAGRYLEQIRRVHVGILDLTREAMVGGEILPLKAEFTVEEPENGMKGQVACMAAKALKEADRIARNNLWNALLLRALEVAGKKHEEAAA